MASTGDAVTYREFEARSNQLAGLLRAHGLGRLDHYSIFMENNDRYLETCSAGERAGLYYTCVNSYLTAEQYQVTHTQLVPTMFSRMLKLPAAERERHDLSSLEFAVHAAAPCPVPVKEQMIDWWGPIIHEYYGRPRGSVSPRATPRSGWHTRVRLARSCSATSSSPTTR
jgi:acyl-coenzyme A synthetase/AMP-(fatty) acid ligase